MIWFVVRDYVPFLSQPGGYAAVAAQVSRIAAAAKRRRAQAAEPNADPPANDGGSHSSEPEPASDAPLPPPPEVSEGAGEQARARAQKRRDIYAEATSIRHLLTHSPPNPYCDACRSAKGLRVPHRKGALEQNGGEADRGRRPPNYGLDYTPE